MFVTFIKKIFQRLFNFNFDAFYICA